VQIEPYAEAQLVFWGGKAADMGDFPPANAFSVAKHYRKYIAPRHVGA
jgi:hypothetical protein